MGAHRSGERRPTLETTFKLARALEVPPAELFAWGSTESHRRSLAGQEMGRGGDEEQPGAASS
jgi:hypothetical protein